MSEASKRVAAASALVIFSGVLVATSSTLPSMDAQAQAVCSVGHPLTYTEVQGFTGPYSRGRYPLLETIKACGVDFIATTREEADLRQAGAKDEILNLLRPASTPAPETGKTKWTPLTDRREMVWLGPDSYRMGSSVDEAGRAQDETPHLETIDRGLWLDTAEVSNEAYQKFVKSQPQWSKTRLTGIPSYLDEWTGDNFPVGEGQKPVVNVHLTAAREFAKWAGKRLPTEEEWEYAARAGTSTPYWWGRDFQADKANNKSNELWPVTAPGTQNRWGLYNMLGNVWEWAPPRSNPQQAIVRGGGAGNAEASLRAARRMSFDPNGTGPNLGFRCALSGGVR